MNRRNSPTLMVFLGLVALGGASAMGQAPSADLGDAIAIVNGERILEKQVADELMVIYGREAVNWFIDRALIEQEAKKNGVDVTPQEVQARLEKEVDRLVDRIMADYQIKSRAELAEFIKRRGDTLESTRQRFAARLAPQIRPTLLEEKLLRLKITVSPEEVQERFQKLYGPRLEAQQIVVATKKEADDLVAKIRAGADFAILARDHSLDTASKGSGGRLRTLPADSELGRAMAGLAEGQVSDPVPIGPQFHIFKLNKRISPENVSPAEAEAKIREELIAEKIEQLRISWRTALRDKADIRILKPLY